MLCFSLFQTWKDVLFLTPVKYEVTPSDYIQLLGLAIKPSQHSVKALTFSHQCLKAGGKELQELAGECGMTSSSQAETGSCLFWAEDDLVGLTNSNKWHVAKSSSHSHRHKEVLTQCVQLKPQCKGPLVFTIGTEDHCELITSNWETCVCVQGLTWH